MHRTFLLAAAGAIAACGQQSEAPPVDESNGVQNSAEIVAPASEIEDSTPAENDPAIASAIPAAFHGRWGMVPADCTSTKGDAKGLITVGADRIEFYESRALLTEVTMDAPENFTGEFAFTGEGQAWTKTQNLQLTGSSNTLVRGETDPSASYTYTRCDQP